MQSGVFLGRLLKLSIKVILPSMKNALTRLAKSVLILLELTTTASAAGNSN